MNIIPETPRIAYLGESTVSRTVVQTPFAQSLQLQKSSQDRQAASFSMSNTLENFQTQLTQVLVKNGFAQEQAARLMHAGITRLGDFSRSMLISQALLSNPQLYDRFAKNLRQILLREQNNEQGVKVFLDVMDQILGVDSKQLIEGELAGSHLLEVDRKGNNYQGDGGEKGFPLPVEDLSRLIDKAAPHIPRHLSAAQLRQMQTMMDFSEVSVEEFPQRFAADLYAFSELHKLGMNAAQYLKLSSEVPPLRLVNLLHAVQRLGQHTQGILDLFLTAFEQGESLKDVLEQMELRFGVQRIMQAGSVGGFPGDARTLPMDTQLLTLHEGENVVIDFFGMDRFDGLVPEGRSGFVLFPQNEEFLGNQINLAFLPVGIYYLVAATINSRQKMMTLWKKVVVQARHNREKKAFSEDQKQGQEKNQSPNQSFKPLPNEPTDILPLPSPVDPLSMHFSGDVPKRGLFVGEIVLPLSDVSAVRNAPLLWATNTGIIVTQSEYENGVFPHNALLFRFLAGELVGGDSERRHAVLKLCHSRPFEILDLAIKDFMINAQEKLPIFLGRLNDFFEDLLGLFPAGEKTFETAHELMAREAQAYASGQAHPEMYRVQSREERQRDFVSASYVKGAYAMASVGHVSGALRGLTYASLTNWDDDNQKAVLGEYLENIRNVHFAKAKEPQVRSYYDTHLRHSTGEKLLASPIYKTQGEAFIRSFDFPPVDLPGPAFVVGQ